MRYVIGTSREVRYGRVLVHVLLYPYYRHGVTRVVPVHAKRRQLYVTPVAYLVLVA